MNSINNKSSRVLAALVLKQTHPTEYMAKIAKMGNCCGGGRASALKRAVNDAIGEDGVFTPAAVHVSNYWTGLPAEQFQSAVAASLPAVVTAQQTADEAAKAAFDKVVFTAFNADESVVVDEIV
jgi:hypothetical protein